ncbi:hypothetical protein RJZ56_004457 [Blastomyces dermatitidis]|uniref:DUF676 domain-containing protein n=2 Tax=Ajellomyces dermatitidis TaxID=5039 RepID=F2TP30_AJEDA|nr:uncharacterized protein BDCG_09083 [Blastomyces dermatitidis ER-3]EEQ85814.1 hypothetical protein BDCG_09083 [Blastomyces dermatitidis ER-3]EGE84993.1 hypothetical protein BDDG_07938 [Blastomyces dermatitidis ATCC 18188]EQL34050.1 hypothetical protein BDFG_03972 [Blastomyces dermatitidis ATCC 26199]
MSDQDIQRTASPGGSLDFDIPIPVHRRDTIHLTPYSTPLPYVSDDDDAQAGRRGRSPTRSRVKEDSRSPSMQSLLPVYSIREGRRTLLLVYIHGFVGSDTSFKKFPAHVHNLLTVMLSESHVVHSKIYPRYKTRKAIEFVRDDFSYWLTPHESPNTDIVLVGHSLGGILAAEIALLGPSDPQVLEMFRHRIMGTINLDVPFLGLHHGVVASGIGSLFRPKDKKKKKNDPQNQPFPVDSSIMAPYISSAHDPNFDPMFPNDIRLTERSQLDGALNFIFKNSNQLVDATRKYISSHVEFGLCIADYPGLKRRYRRLRELEDIDGCNPKLDGSGRPFRRIRFVNYYTAATGKIKSPASENNNDSVTNASGLEGRSMAPGSISSPEPGHVRSLSVDPRRPTEEKTGDSLGFSQGRNEGEGSPETPQLVIEQAHSPPENTNTAPVEDTYPDFPPPPNQPPEFDPSLYGSKALLKEAQKDHSRQMKTYEKAVKEREKKMKAHKKLTSKQERAAEKEQLQRNKEILFPTSSPTNHNYNYNSSPTSGALPNGIKEVESACNTPDINPSTPSKPKKDRKFCALPPREADGERDPLWVRVYMEGVDEVTAHQSLFVSRNAAYDRLVGDVAARIEGWVQDDLTTQVLKNASEEK